MYNPEKPTTLGTLDTARRHDRSLSGDVRVSIYCDHHVQLTLFCICMNLNTFCIWTCYIICHSCCNAWPSLSNDSCGGWWSSSQRCSIWFKSGDFEDM